MCCADFENITCSGKKKKKPDSFHPQSLDRWWTLKADRPESEKGNQIVISRLAGERWETLWCRMGLPGSNCLRRALQKSETFSARSRVPLGETAAFRNVRDHGASAPSPVLEQNDAGAKPVAREDTPGCVSASAWAGAPRSHLQWWPRPRTCQAKGHAGGSRASPLWGGVGGDQVFPPAAGPFGLHSGNFNLDNKVQIVPGRGNPWFQAGH